MNTPFIKDSELRDRVAGLNGLRDPTKLEPWWTQIIEDANRSAVDYIYAALGNRGFTKAQIAQWDSGRDYNTDIALFWAFTRGGIPAGYSDLNIKKLDRRLELTDAIFTIGGVVISPGDPNLLVFGGRMSEKGYRVTMDTEF